MTKLHYCCVASSNTNRAMTVHKSQGSEFDPVQLILPDEDPHPLVFHELIYTAVSRCRHTVAIHASQHAFAGVGPKLVRSPGLATKLGWSRNDRNLE